MKQLDEGNWRVKKEQQFGSFTSEEKVFVESNDLKHDVRLYVDGDFANIK